MREQWRRLRDRVCWRSQLVGEARAACICYENLRKLLCPLTCLEIRSSGAVIGLQAQRSGEFHLRILW